MKILHVINSLNYGGAERLVVDTAPFFKKNGCDIDVLILTDSEQFFKDELLTKGFKVVPLCRKNKSPYNPFIIFKLIKHIKKYDIVHVHLFPAQYWVALAKYFSWAKCKLITTEHNTYNRRRSFIFFKPIDKFIYSLYEKIISISNKTTENLEEYLGKDGVYTIENGIDLIKFKSTKQIQRNSIHPSLDDDDILLCMVGGFREQKDQDTLIQSLKLLPNKYKLLLVGDGKRKSECINKVKNLGLEKKVYFLGLRNDVPNILKSIDIYVMSSYWEGLCLAAVEAMAASRPVVVSNVPGLEEIVTGAGIVFERGNIEELASIVESLGDDESYRAHISLQCSKRADKYDINNMVKKYIEIYDEILN